MINYYYQNFLKSTKTVFSEIQARQIKEMPIKIGSEHEQKTLVALVDNMLSLNKRLAELGDKQTDERIRREREIAETDRKIDELVYDLYGLTKEERRIVEELVK